MAAPTTPEFLDRFPELAGYPVAVIEASIATAAGLCGEEVWGDRHGDAVAFYAASIVTDRVREMGATLGQVNQSPRGRGETHNFYRQQYEDMLRTRPVSGFTV